jgi:RloB-like protein
MSTRRRRQPERPVRRGRPAFGRETNLTRASNVREEGRSVLIVTNGVRTEVDYFNGIKTEPWITANKVVVKFEPGEPTAAVTRAAVLRDDSDYDEAWVVCDVDNFDVTETVTNAHNLQVELTLSVPCFEVWLILHLSNKCPGFNDCPQADRHLRGILPGWDKTALRFSDFRGGVFDAVIRAQRLGAPPDSNPSTAVWRLIESLNMQPRAETKDNEEEGSQGADESSGRSTKKAR